MSQDKLEPTKQASIPQALESHEAAIQELEVMVERVLSSFGPVLRPARPDDSPDKDCMSSTCELEQKLLECTVKIDYATERLQDIVERNQL